MKNKGFSLIELLVVLAILGILASIVAPKLMKHVGGAKSKAAKLQLNDIGAALDLYYLELSDYPSTKEGLKALSYPPEGKHKWNGPYLKKKNIPTDPWGNEYHYMSPGKHGPYDLYSYGKDNKMGGLSEDEDVLNRE